MDKTEFNFDEWARLAQEDPARFERQRRELLDVVIAAAPAEHHQRLKGLQFRLDLERQRAKTPMGAVVRMNSLMWDSFLELRGALQRLADPTGPQAVAATAPRPPARILAFRPRPAIVSGRSSQPQEEEGS